MGVRVGSEVQVLEVGHEDHHLISTRHILEWIPNPWSSLAASRVCTCVHCSIAPNIFGHMDIKRGLLLMLLGGIHKVPTRGNDYPRA